MGMSTLTRILSTLVMAVAGLVLMAGPAAAQEIGYGDPDLTVSLSASASSTEITAFGSGFVPGEPVTGTVFSDPMDLGTKDADSSGNVRFTFSVRDLDPGQHRLVLSAPSGSVTARFTVLGGNDGDGGSGVVIGVNNGSDSSSDDNDSDSSSDDNDSDSSSGDSSDSSSSDDSDSSSSSDSSDSSSSGDSSDADGLAFTGSNLIVPLSVVGALLLVGGGFAVVSSRRKRSKSRV